MWRGKQTKNKCIKDSFRIYAHNISWNTSWLKLVSSKNITFYYFLHDDVDEKMNTKFSCQNNFSFENSHCTYWLTTNLSSCIWIASNFRF